MHPALIKFIDSSFDLVLARKWQARLGGHLLRRARGEGNSDWKTNGERRLMDRYKKNYLMNLTEPVIFDVGANVGEWSKALSGNMPASTVLYCFEPSKNTYNALERNLRNAALGVQYTVQNYGLSDTPALATMYCTGDTAGTNSLFKGHFESLSWTLAGEEEIELRVGDDVANERGISHIHLLKIDTEGSELSVMRGLKSLFSHRAISCVQFEYGYCWIESGSFLKHVFELLTPYGYRIGKICPWGVEYFDRYNHLEETFSYANYVGVLPDLAHLL